MLLTYYDLIIYFILDIITWYSSVSAAFEDIAQLLNNELARVAFL